MSEIAERYRRRPGEFVAKVSPVSPDWSEADDRTKLLALLGRDV